MTTVSIVGAGPGAPDLLTRRAENRLKSAQVLIWTEGYDSLTKSYTDGAEVNLLPRKEHTYTNLVMKAF